MKTQPKPLLSDVQFGKIKFEPGQKILARVTVDLSPAQYANIARAVKKTCGEVSVAIVNCLKVTLIRNRPGQPDLVFCSEMNAQKQAIEQGVANLSCTPIDIVSGDMIMVKLRHSVDQLTEKRIIDWMKDWAGKDIEIRVIGGDLG